MKILPIVETKVVSGASIYLDIGNTYTVSMTNANDEFKIKLDSFNYNFGNDNGLYQCYKLILYGFGDYDFLNSINHAIVPLPPSISISKVTGNNLVKFTISGL